MYSIGEISKLVSISVDALRYYDEIGLLKPYFIEQDSRYRYYSEDQVNEILSIMEMKQYGFSLEEIKELVRSDNNQLLSAYSEQLKKLDKEKMDIAKAIHLLKSRITELEGKDNINMEEKTVLIADDSEFMRMILKDLLEKHNYKVTGSAINGMEAVKMYEELKPAIVIMDIHMADAKDGITALKKIKAQDSEAKIVMLSAISFMSNVLESIQSGASHFIVKPFAADLLITELGKVLDIQYECNKDAILDFQNNIDIAPYTNTPMSQNSADKLLDLCSAGNKISDAQISEFINSFSSAPCVMNMQTT